LIDRWEAQQNRALNRGELSRFLVTFLDNHDSFWQPGGRYGNGAPAEQIIGGVGYLLCSLGTACIYYGTEQGFEGHGGDVQIREAMFDKNTNASLLNTDCTIYKEIAKIAQVRSATPALRFGRLYFREISSNGIDFGFPFGSSYTLAFSRMLYGREVLVAYNVSDQRRNDCVIIDSGLHQTGSKMNYIYGKLGKEPVQQAPGGARFVRLDLAPRQFVILQ
jgi:alpha-amylase